MKKPLVVSLFGIVFITLLFVGWNLQSHPSTEFDEGVYTTTFQLANSGFPLYTKTFLSQPPGFFIINNPIFTLLGKTIEAGRLSVFFWSIIGLLGFVWIGEELALPLLPFFAIGLAYAIPLYHREILTFHADAAPATFSLLSIAALLHFRNTNRFKWIYVAIIFLVFALLIKADLTVLPFVFILLTKKRVLRHSPWMIGFFITVVLLLCLPFGLKSVFENVIQLRLHAMSHYPFNPVAFMKLLQQEYVLGVFFVIAVLSSLFYSIFSRKDSVLYGCMGWIATVFLGLLVYKPLFLHHLFFLVVPTILLLSYVAARVLKQYKQVSWVIAIGTLLIGIIPFALSVPTTSKSVLQPDEEKAVELIVKNTKKTDFIVSDDGLLPSSAQRLSPPYLSDISYVRINSGNLTADMVIQQIQEYQPILILAWNGRLLSLPSIENRLQKVGYTPFVDTPSGRKVFVRRKE